MSSLKLKVVQSMEPTTRDNLNTLAHFFRCIMNILQASEWPEELKPLMNEIYGAVWSLEHGVDIALDLPVVNENL